MPSVTHVKANALAIVHHATAVEEPQFKCLATKFFAYNILCEPLRIMNDVFVLQARQVKWVVDALWLLCIMNENIGDIYDVEHVCVPYYYLRVHRKCARTRTLYMQYPKMILFI